MRDASPGVPDAEERDAAPEPVDGTSAADPPASTMSEAGAGASAESAGMEANASGTQKGPAGAGGEPAAEESGSPVVVAGASGNSDVHVTAAGRTSEAGGGMAGASGVGGESGASGGEGVSGRGETSGGGGASGATGASGAGGMSGRGDTSGAGGMSGAGGTSGAISVAGAGGMAGAISVAGAGGMSGRGDTSGSGGTAGAGAASGSGASGSAGAAGAIGGAAAPVCPSPIAADSRAAQRASCSFGAGTLPRDSLELTASQQSALPIRHIIVMMKENRSYDHYFGQLHSQGQPDSEAVPMTFSNLDLQKQKVVPYHLTTACLRTDPGHQWKDMHDQVNGGAMDGFVTSAARSTSTDGHFALGYYDATDMPFYYFLANTFALADRHFAAVRSGTAPNRAYLLLGTSDGVRESNTGYPSASTTTIFNRLDAKAVSWGVYATPVPFEGALNWSASHAGVADIPAFKRALADGTLPAVTFIDSREDVEDEHPTADVQVGEAWTRDIYQAVTTSPLWPSIALIWTYDEAGGFFDHVPPPNGCVARPQDTAFFELGARVPTVVISPWARAHYVSHVVRDHTAILRLIETVFDLSALTARDANSDALLDMFDFACPPRLSLPPAPAAGTGRCR